jgi:16S rRNA (cytidine1402-2'-O)-methyltransferase
VVPVPGASSVLAALTASGLPTDRFVFEGFLPWKSGARASRLRELCADARTAVLFESPRRMLRLLEELAEVCGERRVAVARELTKQFEEILRGTVSEVREKLAGRASLKGEFVVVVEGAGRAAKRRRDRGRCGPSKSAATPRSVEGD